MKIATKSIAVTLIAMAAGNAAAAGQAWQERCKQAEDMATQVITSRQNGVPASKVMGVFEGESAGDKAWQRVVLMAYDKPRFSSPEYQQRAIEDFANTVYSGCAQAALQ